MLPTTKNKLIRGIGVGTMVVPTFIATMTQFPIWIQRDSNATISATFLIFAFLSCIPFQKQIKEWAKSPSAWEVWTILFILFNALENIVSEMKLVAFIGAISGLAGAGIYRLGKEDNLEKELK